MNNLLVIVEEFEAFVTGYQDSMGEQVAYVEEEIERLKVLDKYDEEGEDYDDIVQILNDIKETLQEMTDSLDDIL